MEDDPLTVTTKCGDCGAETPVVFEGAQTAAADGALPFNKTVDYHCSGCGKADQVSVALAKPGSG